MKNILLKFARWVFRHYGIQAIETKPVSVSITVTPQIRALMNVARVETAKAEGYSKSGEWKRHRVYAQMIKIFPNAARRDISKAIELSLP